MGGTAEGLGVAPVDGIALLPVLALGDAEFVESAAAERALAVLFFVNISGATLASASGDALRLHFTRGWFHNSFSYLALNRSNGKGSCRGKRVHETT
jgi:hypothetical protein